MSDFFLRYGVICGVKRVGEEHKGSGGRRHDLVRTTCWARMQGLLLAKGTARAQRLYFLTLDLVGREYRCQM